jgi:hypothetical protein
MSAEQNIALQSSAFHAIIGSGQMLLDVIKRIRTRTV